MLLNCRLAILSYVLASLTAVHALDQTKSRPLSRRHQNGPSTHHGSKRLIKRLQIVNKRQSSVDNSTVAGAGGGLIGGLLGGGDAATTTTTTSSSAALPTTTTAALTTTTPAAVLTTTTATTTAADLTTTVPTTSSATTIKTTKTSDVLSTTSVPTSTSASVSSTSSSSASAVPTLNPEDKKSSSSGLSKTALIIIIAVASSVAAIAAIWTIIRKTAFGTSKRFEAKLEPIEWSDPLDTHRNDTYAYGAVGSAARNGSVRGANGGYASSLGRSDSGKGSERGGTMAEAYPPSIPYNGPAYVPAPYFGGPPPGNGYGAPAGYPHEQANFGYADLQRGASLGGGSVAASSGSARPDLMRAPTSIAYDYGSQQRQQQQFGPRY